MRTSPSTRIGWILLLPSFLCLDAPLVALGWARCFAEGKGRGPEFGALFFSVWAVYLADRIYDVGRVGGLASPDLPLRHEWGCRHRRLLMILAGVAGFGLAASLMAGLARETVRAGFWIGAGTALYYAVFRSPRASFRSWRGIPAKEFGIAIPFACGVAAAATSGWFAGVPPMLFLSLVLLVAGNCLLIARAERDWDRVVDAAAFFSDRSRPGRLSEGVLVAACAVALGELVRKPGDGAVAILVCAVPTLVLACLRGETVQRHMQPLADGIQLAAWLVPPFAAVGSFWTA